MRRASGVMSAHSAKQIITVVTFEASDRPSTVAVALAVVSEALAARLCQYASERTMAAVVGWSVGAAQSPRHVATRQVAGL